MNSRVLTPIVLLLSCAGLFAASSINVPDVPSLTGIRYVAKAELGFNRMNFPTYVALDPIPPLVVPADGVLEIYATVGESETPTFYKNGVALSASDHIQIVGQTLRIDKPTLNDAGIYTTQGSEPLVVRIGKSGSMINTSARGYVVRTDKTLVFGMVVNGTRNKKVLIRAVGPSLEKFGITNFLPEPAVQIYDSNGQPYSNGYVYANPVTGVSAESDLRDSTSKAGAFALVSGAKDIAMLQSMKPGLYTVAVTGANDSEGVALLEFYEVTEE